MPVINENIKELLETTSREIVICTDTNIHVYSYLSYNKNF